MTNNSNKKNKIKKQKKRTYKIVRLTSDERIKLALKKELIKSLSNDDKRKYLIELELEKQKLELELHKAKTEYHKIKAERRAKLAELNKRKYHRRMPAIKRKFVKNKIGPVSTMYSFEEARAIVRAEFIPTAREYIVWHRSHRPVGIPQNPQNYYKDEFTSWNDWLGNPLDKKPIVNRQGKDYRDFFEARKYARSLMLKTREDWFKLHKQGKMPSDLPYRPEACYGRNWNGKEVRGGHWIGWKDFLGTSFVDKMDAMQDKIDILIITKMDHYPSNVYAFISLHEFEHDIHRKIREEKINVIKAYQQNDGFDWGIYLKNNFNNYYNMSGLYIIPNVNQVIYHFDMNMDKFDTTK